MRLKERCFSLRPCSPHLQGISLQVMCHNIFGFLQHIHCQSQNKNKRRIHRTTWLSSTGCPLSLVSPCPSSASTHPPAVWQMLNKNPPGVWQILSENPSFMLVSFLSLPTWTTLLSWYLLIFLSTLTNTADYWQILTKFNKYWRWDKYWWWDKYKYWKILPHLPPRQTCPAPTSLPPPGQFDL